MTRQAFSIIVNALERALRQLKGLGLEDSRIRERYAEYWVAQQLCARGRRVQILSERKETGADVYLPDENIRIEVKSGFFDEGGFAYGSFGLGKQIKQKKFDFCVFLTFAATGGVMPKDVFIFSRDELKEVAKPRRRLADHPDSNPCLLIYGHSTNAYNGAVERWRIRAFEIERKLHQKPREFRKAWEKIRKSNERDS